MLIDLMSRPLNNDNLDWRYVGGKYRAKYVAGGNVVTVYCDDDVVIKDTDGNVVSTYSSGPSLYEASVHKGDTYYIEIEHTFCKSIAVFDNYVDLYNSAKYNEYRNASDNAMTVTLYSSTDSVVYVDGEEVGTVTANDVDGFTLSVPSQSVVRAINQSCIGSSECPLIKVGGQSVTGLEVVKIDPSSANYSHAFYNCTALTAIPQQWAIGESSISDISYMFYGCTNLQEIPKSFSGLGKVTDMRYAFYGCSGITDGGSSNFNVLYNVTLCGHAFEGCSSWTGPSYSIYQRLSTKDVAVTDFENCFAGCTSSKNYKVIPTTWGGLGEEIKFFTFKNVSDKTVYVTLISDSKTEIYVNQELYDTFNEDSVAGTEYRLAVEPDAVVMTDGLNRNASFHHYYEEMEAWEEVIVDEYFYEDEAQVMKSSETEACIDILSFDNDWVTMNSAFKDCKVLRKLPSKWGSFTNSTYSGLRSLNSAFSGCENLISIPDNFVGLDSLISDSNILGLCDVFHNCKSIKTVPYDWNSVKLYNWMYSSSSIRNMFSGCCSLETGVITYKTKKVTSTGIVTLVLSVTEEETYIGRFNDFFAIYGTSSKGIESEAYYDDPEEAGEYRAYINDGLLCVDVYAVGGETLYYSDIHDFILPLRCYNAERPYETKGYRNIGEAVNFMRGCSSWTGFGYGLYRLLERNTRGYCGQSGHIYGMLHECTNCIGYDALPDFVTDDYSTYEE